MSQDAARAERLSLPLTFAFSATSLPLAALAVTIGVYVAPHYSGPLGLDIGLVGLAFMLVRLIDIPVDFLLGVAMDRTRTRWGRFRLWTVIGGPVTFLAVYMLFFAKPGVSMAYLVGWLLVLYVGTSILALAHAAWASTLARSYDERSRLYGIMAAVGVGGSTLVLLTPDIVRLFDPTSNVGVHGMGGFILLAVPITVLLVVFRTPEHMSVEIHGHQFKLKEYWSLVARPSMARLIAADFFLAMGPQWTGALYIFFFTDRMGYTGEQVRLLLALYMFAGFLGAPLVARLAVAISKHRAAMVALAGWGLILASLMLTPDGNIPLGAIQMFSLGFLAAGFNVLTRAMTADISDEVRLEQGKERSGVLFAFTTLVAKLAGAFAVGISYMVLDNVGYKSGAVNTPEAIQGMVLAYIVGPVVFMLVAAISLRGYPLSRDRHAEIRKDLEARDATYAAQALDNNPG